MYCVIRKKISLIRSYMYDETDPEKHIVSISFDQKIWESHDS
jgi:hypothetical protein